MVHRLRRYRTLLAASVALFAASAGMAAGRTVDWQHYGGNQAGTRYTTLKQIKPTNVGKLKVAWRYDIDTRRWHRDGERAVPDRRDHLRSQIPRL